MLVKGLKPCFIKPVSFTRTLTLVKEIIQIGKCVQLNGFDRALKNTVNCYLYIYEYVPLAYKLPKVFWRGLIFRGPYNAVAAAVLIKGHSSYKNEFLI